MVLQNECLTTSGNTKSTKWPIQKPQTRETIERNQTLSVVTDDPATGEVLSTSLYIANEDEKHFILTQLKGKIINFN
jgi:thiamine biosynthesis lipoprotein